jgi:hypothetical protein
MVIAAMVVIAEDIMPADLEASVADIFASTADVAALVAEVAVSVLYPSASDILD